MVGEGRQVGGEQGGWGIPGRGENREGGGFQEGGRRTSGCMSQGSSIGKADRCMLPALDNVKQHHTTGQGSVFIVTLSITGQDPVFSSTGHSTLLALVKLVIKLAIHKMFLIIINQAELVSMTYNSVSVYSGATKSFNSTLGIQP